MSIADTVARVNQQLLGPGSIVTPLASVPRQVARGIAYQAVASSTALAIQNAAQVMTNTGVVAATAMAAIAANIVKAPPASVVQWAPAIAPITVIAAWGPTYFAAVSAAATTVATTYPSS